ncbi:ATP-grasp domain-containing protein [Sphingomonas sp. ABOLD]|uniref:3-methylcrotonyl-CoA carboxylase alpha subunit n=1 Tax=Sphingomonas trueperi TaxID=53317 RepID=A0A7X6BCV7_9SPHN|nr:MULTISPECIES: biotin carboxylase N-terminal domain-containing protein [Sphingomonas]NJB97052.1 3-methylcrotonyl-CoA carboxylase alpha subunit [Sphingomonas trueperi]RSV50776.1 ATP-grasp domain-containing protein [Sphingomonas sp. ABOLD]
MLKSLLIANRGEIACRIIRTARAMGLRTIAVYSDADSNALHVRQADEAVHIGPSPARESYLVAEKIIAAAKATGAEAIHPGYGFLSENADFAEAVIAAGLVWVGPKPESIRAMGLKDAAKARMIAAGVPVTPGYLGEDQLPERLRAEADAIGYPVLIKAVAGGGGKGMRRVESAAEFADALASCKREAASSFGDDRVLLEKYILSPRHIEVQVFGDTHGNVVHLFERDCSLQRRHQKVIEEAPAPGMDAETREAICAAAVRAAKAVDYVGAGTIEFIADASEGLRADRIWFMEMNTRLQVEHPVTEEITGQDLVEWQLRVASGEPLPRRQEELSINGWAMEARLYAEDPAKGFLPSVGRLDFFGIGESHIVRIETGVGLGTSISPFYDPMIAKVVSSGSTRERARSQLAAACHNTIVAPVKTNAAFLWRCLRHKDFIEGTLDTGFIARNEADLIGSSSPSQAVIEAAAMAVLHDEMGDGEAVQLWRHESRREPQPVAGATWRDIVGFRLNAAPRIHIALRHENERYTLDHLVEKPAQLSTIVKDDKVLVADMGQSFLFERDRYSGGASGTVGDGALLAPMPGRITAVDVAAGAQVTKGQRLVTLEAMKMEHALTAPFDGTVAELPVAAGGQVTEGSLLVRVEKAA